MNIQSLSIVVPCGDHCVNNCRFCVSRSHHEDYGAQIVSAKNIPQSYMDKVQFTRDEGCNSLIFTGTTEPQQNLSFIYKFLSLNRSLRTPFYNISIQTTGAGLTPGEIEKMSVAGINTLALSLSSFYDEENWDIIQTPKQWRTLDSGEIIEYAKSFGMNVRLCLNLTSAFAEFPPHVFFSIAQNMQVDQLTFRKIYSTGEGEQAEWITAHVYPQKKFEEIIKYVKEKGRALNRLPFGAIKYDVRGISTVVDDDCMAKNNIEEIRYLILRPNNHLYSSWDSTASLVF